MQVKLHIYDLTGGMARQVIGCNKNCFKNHIKIFNVHAAYMCRYLSISQRLKRFRHKQMSMGFIGKQIDGIWHTGKFNVPAVKGVMVIV